jgi:triphosphoribosyl-dephospho-CoA synthase
VTAFSDAIAEAFLAACHDELEAPKPGNVHVFSPTGSKSMDDFIRSAEAAAPPICAPGARVGARILGAIEATAATVGSNTNLGIVLLCAPLAAAAEGRPTDLRAALARVLADLDVADADRAFHAIVLAAPGGLGRAACHDVFAPATVTLGQAMAEAADRDRIARQYVSAFEDVFVCGETARSRQIARGSNTMWATLATYLTFVATLPDTHVVREHGAAAAEEVRRIAGDFLARLQMGNDPSHLLPDLLAWDESLKRQGLNPGTSADLTVATLFAHRLQNILPPTRNSD